MNGFPDQLRHAARALRKSPGFTFIAILTLALGIGGNTAIFTFMNTLMLRPLPYPQADQLVTLYRTSPQSKSWPHSVANFLDHRAENTVFEKLVAYEGRRFSHASPGEPAESLHGLAATADFFDVLNVPPFLGRTFAPNEDQPGNDKVTVISHSFWTRRLESDPHVVGKSLRLDGETLTVIGVMPPSFDFPILWGPIDAWRPLTLSSDERRDRENNYLQAFGRLKPGVTLKQADAAMKSVAANLSAAHPESNAQNSLRVIPLSQTIGDESSRRIAWLMLCLSGFVLIIACVNLANLQLARSAVRAREFGVRLALGCSRARLMSQLLAESLLIAAFGGVSGILIAMWLSKFLGHQMDRWSPAGIDMTVDHRVLLFAVAASLLTGLVFGVGPAWIAARSNMNEMLKAGSRGSTAARSQNLLRHILIVSEVALALVLLTGALLFIGGLNKFIAQEPGWSTDHLLTAWLPLSNKYNNRPDEYLRVVQHRLAAIPGVKRASIACSIPIWSFGTSRSVYVEGQPTPARGQEPLINVEPVSPNYFDTMEIRLLQGRQFNEHDTSDKLNVAIINEAMAKKFWPIESPLGKRINNGDLQQPEWLEVIGVVNDLRFPANPNRQDTLWQVYRPLAQESRNYYAIQLRTTGDPSVLINPVRNVIAEIDPDLPLNDLEPTTSYIHRILGQMTLAARILVGFAVLGLLLSALGIYGVISFLAAQRTAEVGIRMALGAQRRNILWLILHKAILLAALGIVLGLSGAYAITKILAAAVPEIPTKNPSAIFILSMGLIATATAAALVPAWRATRCDPTKVLRDQ